MDVRVKLIDANSNVTFGNKKTNSDTYHDNLLFH